MSTQDPEFFMAAASHFDLASKSVKNTTGKNLIWLDEDLFGTIFKCPNLEKYSDITMQSAQTYYHRNCDKCRRNMNDN